MIEDQHLDCPYILDRLAFSLPTTDHISHVWVRVFRILCKQIRSPVKLPSYPLRCLFEQQRTSSTARTTQTAHPEPRVYWPRAPVRWLARAPDTLSASQTFAAEVSITRAEGKMKSFGGRDLQKKVSNRQDPTL